MAVKEIQYADLDNSNKSLANSVLSMAIYGYVCYFDFINDNVSLYPLKILWY